MLNLCISFDYELFFGKSLFPPQEILVNSTNRICKILSEYDVKATFFSDVAMSIRHRQVGLGEVADAIDNQLLNLIAENHDVQLHIHPFWYTAKYIGNEWHFDNRYYRLHDFIDASPDYKKIIDETYSYLTELLQTVDKSYKCVAFRAGGFCIQPEGIIIEELKKKGIKIDSSVCKNIRSSTSSHYYNYYSMPNKNNWKFSLGSGICKEDIEGDFFEVPVGSVFRIPSKWIIVHCSPKLKREPLKGTTSRDTDTKKSIPSQILEKAYSFFTGGVMMSLDSSHYLALEKMIKWYLSEHKLEEDAYVAVIGHSKLFGNSNYENLYNFLRLMKIKYSDTIRFVTFNDIYKKIYEEK